MCIHFLGSHSISYIFFPEHVMRNIKFLFNQRKLVVLVTSLTKFENVTSSHPITNMFNLVYDHRNYYISLRSSFNDIKVRKDMFEKK